MKVDFLYSISKVFCLSYQQQFQNNATNSLIYGKTFGVVFITLYCESMRFNMLYYHNNCNNNIINNNNCYNYAVFLFLLTDLTCWSKSGAPFCLVRRSWKILMIFPGEYFSFLSTKVFESGKICDICTTSSNGPEAKQTKKLSLLSLHIRWLNLNKMLA